MEVTALGQAAVPSGPVASRSPLHRLKAALAHCFGRNISSPAAQ